MTDKYQRLRDVLSAGNKSVADQWVAGDADCLQCGYGWVAVWPLGADPLECPQCGSTDTYRSEQ